MPVSALHVGLLRRIAALFLLVGLAGCAQISLPSKVTLSEAELQRLLTAKFPVEQRLLEFFEVRATSPQLRLQPDRDRLAAELDLLARERILATQYKGRLNFESSLRWDGAENAVRLDQVRVLDFALDSAPQAPGGMQTAGPLAQTRRSTAERVAAALAERVLEGMVLYRLPADKLAQLNQAGVQPGKLTIARSGLEITLEPKSK